MRNGNFRKKIVSFSLAMTMLVLPLAATAQTAVSLPDNKYKVQDDVDLGRKTAAQVEQQFPILNDGVVTDYVQDIGQQLVANIPSQFRQPAFDYRFKVVNASDINAFALPGGPMYVNRGMIEAAKNEGEMAGVMAHEIAHIALRHSTAQATKQSSAGNVLGTIGLILGGAILGGQTGAQLGALGAQALQTRYSREFETQSDILGARIMADAGYDPRDLANMFRTIEGQREGGRLPEFLSSHPNPGNRYQNINREATRLNVSPRPIKSTAGFRRAQARLREMSPARTMAQIQRDYQSGQSGSNNSAIANGQYSRNVAYPSARTRVYTGGSLFRISVPTNWREFPGNNDVTFAPNGAYGGQGITHGAMIGVFSQQGANLRGSTESFVQSLLNANPYLRQRTGLTRSYVDSRQGFITSLTGRSPITNQGERVTIYTADTRDGRVFYAITVSPEAESFRYDNTFRNMISSVQLN